MMIPLLLICFVPFFYLHIQTSWTALHFGAERGHLAVVEALIAAGADLEVKTNVSMCMNGPMYMSQCLYSRFNSFILCGFAPMLGFVYRMDGQPCIGGPLTVGGR
jgi:ankyrin repeat protein